MKYIGITLGCLGFVYLLGTAGSSDQGLLTEGETVVNALAGLAAIGAGVLLTRIANQIKIIKNRKVRRK